jgi:hypothetical protein
MFGQMKSAGSGSSGDFELQTALSPTISEKVKTIKNVPECDGVLLCPHVSAGGYTVMKVLQGETVTETPDPNNTVTATLQGTTLTFTKSTASTYYGVVPFTFK